MLASSLSLGACFYTLDSALPPERITFDSTLLGTWVSSDSERAVVTSTDDERYLIDYTDNDGKGGSFFGILGTLGEATVLEVWPATDPELEDWPVGRMQLVLGIAPDSVVTRAFDSDSIRSALESGTLDVAHVGGSEREDLILSAPTADLARALEAQLGRAGALGEPGIWRRAGGR
jgi:hypothetical protein